MRKQVVGATALVLALFVGGCGKDPHDVAMGETFDLLDQMVDVILDVTDEKSAEAAKPRLKALGEQMLELSRKNKARGKPTPEKRKELIRKYTPRLDQLVKKVERANEVIKKYPELEKSLEDWAEQVGQVFEQ